MASNQKSAVNIWKLLLVLSITSTLFSILFLFFLYPEKMDFIFSVISFFSLLFFLNLILPEQKIAKKRIVQDIKKAFALFGLIVGLEFCLFTLSNHFSFITTKTLLPLPSWPIWFGLWAFFSTTINMQHYAYYELKKPNMASSVLFYFENTYLDIVWRRIFVMIHINLNFIATYLLCLELLLTFFDVIEPNVLACKTIALPTILLLYAISPCLMKYLPILGQYFPKTTRLANYVYIFSALLICVFILKIAFFLSAYFSYSPSLFKNLPSLKNTPTLLFCTFFISITPLLSSIIVKYTANISRKKISILCFLLPSLFRLIYTEKVFPNNQSDILTGILIIMFLILLFYQKTTEGWITGALRLPKQRVAIPTKSFAAFPLHCFIIMNLYLLFNTGKATALCAMTTWEALLVLSLNLVGICGYFGISYKRKGT